jgi:hypothetical protein
MVPEIPVNDMFPDGSSEMLFATKAKRVINNIMDEIIELNNLLQIIDDINDDYESIRNVITQQLLSYEKIKMYEDYFVSYNKNRKVIFVYILFSKTLKKIVIYNESLYTHAYISEDINSISYKIEREGKMVEFSSISEVGDNIITYKSSGSFDSLKSFKFFERIIEIMLKDNSMNEGEKK